MTGRANLRSTVRNEIFDRIIDGRLTPGRSAGEAALASELGVSRTPVREALLGLEREGILHSEPGRGFIVPELSEREVRELYPIVWSLEKLAVVEAPKILASDVEILKKINRCFSNANNAKDRKLFDFEWHLSLVSLSRNQRLIKFLQTQKEFLHRYEYVYMRDDELTENSVMDHEMIVESLLSDRVKALEAIENHWREGMARVLDKMLESPAKR